MLRWWVVREIVVLVLLTTVAYAQPVEASPPAPKPPVAPQPGEAQPGEAQPGEAQQPAAPQSTPAMVAFEEGRALLDAGNYEAACAKFTVSIAADPDASGTLLNLGLCNEKLGKTATALGWYRKAQFRSAETRKTADEDAAKQRTIELAAKVPILRIEAAPGAKVSLDGTALDDIERARVEVDPGTHVIEAGAERRTITVRDGDKRAIDLRPPPPKRYVVVDRGATQRRYAYIAAGAGAGLYIASATLSLVGKSKYDAAEHPETYVRWQNIVHYGGTSLFVAGTAAIATGVYLYVRAPRAERVLAPTVGAGQLGVSLVGSF